ncbi:MAG: septum formation inhibitor Maf [Gammaproteobacteria bacterium]|jgi:septum formation protein|nr:septum formation inhibitor Maf [Gammaproteobacteria bacterium]
MTRSPTLILASTSPRRREILATLGLDFTVVPVDVDESPQDGETPGDMALRLAVAKAAAADAHDNNIVLGADTIVAIDGRALGKPVDKADCLAMLERLSGRGHKVLTGVALHGAQGSQTALSETDVYFREISRDEALAYWQSGEPCDKAGAYAVQGLGGVFVERIEGSYSGVVGLPVFETATLLANAGLGVVSRQ